MHSSTPARNGEFLAAGTAKKHVVRQTSLRKPCKTQGWDGEGASVPAPSGAAAFDRGCPASGLGTRPRGQAGPSAMLWFPPAAVSLRGCKWKSGVWPGLRTRAPAARQHTALACSAAIWGCHPGSSAPWGGGGTGMGSAPWEHSPTAHRVPVQRSCTGHGFAGRGPPGLHQGQERSQGVNGFPHPRGGRGASGLRGPAGRGMTQRSSPRPRSPHNVTREVCARCSSFPLAEGFMAAPAAQTTASSLLLLPAGETGAADVRPCAESRRPSPAATIPRPPLASGCSSATRTLHVDGGGSDVPKSPWAQPSWGCLPPRSRLGGGAVGV